MPKTFQVYLSLVSGPSQRTELDPGRNADHSESSLGPDRRGHRDGISFKFVPFAWATRVNGPSQRTELDPGRNADHSESSLGPDAATAYLSNLCHLPGPPGLARDPGYPAAATAGPDAEAAAATVTARPPAKLRPAAAFIMIFQICAHGLGHRDRGHDWHRSERTPAAAALRPARVRERWPLLAVPVTFGPRGRATCTVTDGAGGGGPFWPGTGDG